MSFLTDITSELITGILQRLNKTQLTKVAKTCKLLQSHSLEAHLAQETLKNRISPVWTYTTCTHWNKNPVLEAFGDDEQILINKTIVLQDREHFLINQGKIVYLEDLIYLTKTDAHCVIHNTTLYAIDQVICKVNLLTNTWEEKMDMPYCWDLEHKNIVCFEDTLVMFNSKAVFMEEDHSIQWVRNIPHALGNPSDYIRVFTNEHGIFMCRFDPSTFTLKRMLKYNFYTNKFSVIHTTGPTPIINDLFLIVHVKNQILFIPRDLPLGMWMCVTTRIHAVIHALWVFIPTPTDVIYRSAEKCVYVTEQAVQVVLRDVGCYQLDLLNIY